MLGNKTCKLSWDLLHWLLIMSWKRKWTLNFLRKEYLSISSEFHSLYIYIYIWIYVCVYTKTGVEYDGQVALGHIYHIFYKGCLTNFELNEEDEEEASKLYPDVQYTRMDAYLKRYLWSLSPSYIYLSTWAFYI